MANFYLLLKRVTYIIACCIIPQLISAQPPTISYQSVITGLSGPVDVVNAGDGTNRLFVVEQAGNIKVWNGTTLSLFANLGATGANIITSGGERGLLSMVFHPDYDGVINRYFYVYYTDLAGDIAIRRYQTTIGDINTADVSASTLIITIPHPTNSNHNGGKLNFGPDGYLYFATGDGGGGNDVPNNAQTGTVLLGKMLRIDVDNTSITYGNYALPVAPDENPYVSDPNIDDRIWALGLRNPFRWSFDRLTNDMWIGDVGQGAQEEINFRAAGSTGQVNYGWRCFEGYPSTPGVADCNPVDYVPPVYDYPNPSSGSSAVTGGYVYRGNEYPNFRGYYIASDVYSGEVFLLWPNGSGGFDSSVQSGLGVSFIVAFGEAEDGTLYAVSQGTNRVYKVVATGGTVLPAKLGAFLVTPRNGFNAVNWQTLSEINTARFHIEYGNDGRNFSRVGTVNASRITQGSNYRFNHDIVSSQDMYYRLAIEEDNGAIQYSEILRIGGTRANGIRVYPNPVANGILNLEVSREPVNEIKVYHSNGSVLYKKSFDHFTGNSKIYLPNLPAGVYLVEVTGDKVSHKEKIIVQ